MTRQDTGTRSVSIVEVAPRDGLQNESVPFTTAQKLELVRRAVEAGAREVEVTAFVHPRLVPAMADAADVAAGLPAVPGVTYSALVLNMRGLHRAIESGVGAVNAVVPCTDTFSRRNQGMGLDQAVAGWQEIAREAASAGVTAGLTLAVAFGCPFEGEVPMAAFERVLDAVLQAPPATLSLADTIGVAVPADVRERFAALLEKSPPGVGARAHFHNTRNTGVANAIAAVEAGVRILDASVGGIGGCPFAPKATGNVATEDLAYALHRSGYDTGLDLPRLIEAGQWLEGVLRRPVPGMVRHAGGFPHHRAAV